MKSPNGSQRITCFSSSTTGSIPKQSPHCIRIPSTVQLLQRPSSTMYIAVAGTRGPPASPLSGTKTEGRKITCSSTPSPVRVARHFHTTYLGSRYNTPFRLLRSYIKEPGTHLQCGGGGGAGRRPHYSHTHSHAYTFTPRSPR